MIEHCWHCQHSDGGGGRRSSCQHPGPRRRCQGSAARSGSRSRSSCSCGASTRPAPRYPSWLTVGGSVETGQTPPSAAAREATEEIGLVVDAADLGQPVWSRSPTSVSGGWRSATRRTTSSCASTPSSRPGRPGRGGTRGPLVGARGAGRPPGRGYGGAAVPTGAGRTTRGTPGRGTRSPLRPGESIATEAGAH